MTNYSQNEKAEKLLGKRPTVFSIIDQPCELGYRCPVCKYEQTVDGNYDERLYWSEYNGMIWCKVCNFDYPSCLCKPDPKEAVETFLATVGDALKEQDKRTRHACAEAILDQATSVAMANTYRGKVSNSAMEVVSQLERAAELCMNVKAVEKK